MHKYKYLLMLLGCIATLLLCCFFPISFDNNDDQIMFAISSGIFTGTTSAHIVFINLFIGKCLSSLFSLSNKVNWYTLYLQVLLLLSFLGICYLFIKQKLNTFGISLYIIIFILFGFFSLSIVKVQFTSVALFCTFSALFYLQNNLAKTRNLVIAFLFITASILTRKDAFYIFIAFSIPILIVKFKENKFTRQYILCVVFSFFLFQINAYFNKNNTTYKSANTYSNFEALDIIAAKPIKINDSLLQKNNLTIDDILLIKSWFAADQIYLSGNKIENIAKQLKANRSFFEVVNEWKKFIADERYALFIYLLSIILVLVFSRNFYKITFLNLGIFLFLLIYLTISSRIPHRLTFPIITYLILVNIFSFLESDTKFTVRRNVVFFLFIIGCYKFYCTSKLIKIHTENHKIYEACQQEINTHPKNLFIALDDFPLQYMNAWQTSKNMFPAHNIIIAGWYACTPDYQVLLKLHHLKNLTSDIKNRKDILFLTNSETFQKAYVNVMKQRYDIVCHFEIVKNTFKYLHPKKLVIDN